MKDSARYVKVVEWSEEDQCYVGSAPGLILGGCHGGDEKKVFEELCQIVDEAINHYRQDGKPLPPPTAGRDLANALLSAVQAAIAGASGNDAPEHTLHSQEGRQDMTSSEVVGHYSALDQACVRVWIDGGWAVDALLGRQLRPHKDLDIALERTDVRRLREVLATKGYRQVREYGEWNFVLADDEGHEIDVHVFVCDERGNVVDGMGNVVDGIRYPPESLTGTGTIEGHVVRCISATHMVAFLAPWIHNWPDKYVPAVSALCERFGIELPTEYLEFVPLRP